MPLDLKNVTVLEKLDVGVNAGFQHTGVWPGTNSSAAVRCIQLEVGPPKVQLSQLSCAYYTYYASCCSVSVAELKPNSIAMTPALRKPTQAVPVRPP
jgi:hypothetical protein